MVIICWGIAIAAVIAGVIVFSLVLKRIKTGRNLLLALISVVTVAIVFGSIFTLYGTEIGKRALKDISSNYSGGVARSVEVYDTVGNLKKKYVGKFDVDANETKVLFDDDKGLRHIIYQGTGQIIVDELE